MRHYRRLVWHLFYLGLFALITFKALFVYVTGRANPHFSPGSREPAQDSGSKAPLWSEKRSHSYGLSEEQAYEHEDQPEP